MAVLHATHGFCIEPVAEEITLDLDATVATEEELHMITFGSLRV